MSEVGWLCLSDIFFSRLDIVDGGRVGMDPVPFSGPLFSSRPSSSFTQSRAEFAGT